MATKRLTIELSTDQYALLSLSYTFREIIVADYLMA